ncbi:MAG TPA: tyrosine--tRNA ligase, partial [Actinomycetota bacterium]|nr:tyrosine--tRNA ligase [Actinomycetota bacterium]
MASSAPSRLLDGAADVIPRGGLQEKLSLDRPLRVKLGIDPSRPDLHLGHAVVLRKLRHFQDAGHVAVLIVGDFTGRVGDPSGQSETRPFLTEEEIETNATTYLEQAGTVLDIGSAEVRRNSEWLAGMGMADVLRLTSAYTVARMLERDDFRKRHEEGKPISVVEFLYPLMQAMDSVAVRADIELGGTDQTFNLLVGRDIQRIYGQDPQVVLTMPLLEGIDGERKMSKSFDNWVALTDPPEEMFGKLMRIPDHLITKYRLLAADLDPTEVARIEGGMVDGSLKPVEEKRRMARAVVDLYQGPGTGAEAEKRFDRVHRERQAPERIEEAEIPLEVVKDRDGRIWLPQLMAILGLARSKSAARRLIEQGGVRLDGEQVTDPTAEYPLGELRERSCRSAGGGSSGSA